MKSLSPMFAGSFGLAVRRNGSRLAVLLAAFFVIFAAQALAQEATILGTVTDPTGAAVPNATHHHHQYRHRCNAHLAHQQRRPVRGS